MTTPRGIPGLSVRVRDLSFARGDALVTLDAQEHRLAIALCFVAPAPLANAELFKAIWHHIDFLPNDPAQALNHRLGTLKHKLAPLGIGIERQQGVGTRAIDLLSGRLPRSCDPLQIERLRQLAGGVRAPSTAFNSDPVEYQPGRGANRDQATDPLLTSLHEPAPVLTIEGQDPWIGRFGNSNNNRLATPNNSSDGGAEWQR